MAEVEPNVSVPKDEEDKDEESVYSDPNGELRNFFNYSIDQWPNNFF